MYSKDWHKPLTAGAALLAGMIITTAFGADAPPTSSAATPSAPQGAIDPAKANERAAKMFAAVDANDDGKITDSEFMAANPRHEGPPGGPGMGMSGPHKGMRGPGPDGALTAEQRDARTQAFETELFSALDTDHNGQLSPAEFSKSREVAQNLMKKQMFTKSDKNGDGVLTKDEFPPFVPKLAAMDANGDGTVTHEEIQAARAARGTQPATPQN